MRPSAPQSTPVEPQRRGWLSRLFTRSAKPKKTAAHKKALVGAIALSLAAGSVAMPDDAHAAKRRSTPAGPTPASIILDVENNRVLNELNADTRIHPASTTKLMTAYLVFEALESGRLRADQRLTVSARAAAQPRTNLALRTGSTITVDQALRGLMVHSANDAAVVLGEAVAGSESAFARQMTAQARELGMRNTTFANANGLGAPSQRVTARDMSRLMVALFRDHPELSRRYLAVPSFTYNGTTWTNTNRLLGSDQCPGIIGGKTGYIRAAGTNIIVMAERNNRHVVVGVFGRSTGAVRNNLTCNLINFAYFKMVRDPNATYDSTRTYEVVMPPLPASATPPAPVAPATSGPVPYTPTPVPATPLPQAVNPFAPPAPDAPALQPAFNSSLWQNREPQQPAQDEQARPLFTPASTRYSLRFGG